MQWRCYTLLQLHTGPTSIRVHSSLDWVSFWVGYVRLLLEEREPAGKSSPIRVFSSFPQSSLLHPTLLLPPAPTTRLLHPAGCSPAGRRPWRNHTRRKGCSAAWKRHWRWRISSIASFLHNFVSSGFADQSDALAYRTTKSSTRDGEARAREGRRSWWLGFPQRVTSPQFLPADWPKSGQSGPTAASW
jgi:hypothetical protein